VCGIAGIINTGEGDAGRDRVRVARMIAALEHRGPDSHGLWQSSSGKVTLGHTRLAILDLSAAGHQPMMSACGRFVIVFNGEIYNHLELRSRVHGVEFRGHSDTEALLAFIVQEGIAAALAASVGMYAFALFDMVEHSVTFARDRAGEKPLYLSSTGSCLAFASELRGLLAAHSVPRALDLDAVRFFLSFGYAPVDRSLISGIWPLPPGSMLTVSLAQDDLRGLQSRIRRYWSLASGDHGLAEDLPGRGPGGECAVQGLDALLQGIMPDYLHTDVPIGVMLSGGLDSSLVALMAQQASPEPLRTFTASFPDTPYDESSYASNFASAIGASSCVVPLTDQSMKSAAERLLPRCDSPMANPSFLPLALLCEAARRDVTVCFAGDGADEVLAGYNRHWTAWKLWRLSRHVPRRLRSAGAAAMERVNISEMVAGGWIGASLQRRFGRILAPKIRAVVRMLPAVTLERAYVSSLVTDAPAHLLDDHLLIQPEVACPESADLWRFVDFVRAHDFANYLPGDNLAKADQASMRTSLELRLPLLDRRFVAWAWSLPNDQLRSAATLKAPIAGLLRAKLGGRFVTRSKMGFSVPLDHWLGGPLGCWAKAATMDEGSVLREMIGADAMARIWRDQSAGRSRSRFLWAATSLELWWANVCSEFDTLRLREQAPSEITRATS
jgi:asparagine synthase (glutamine-hydrolysing)